MTTAEFIMTSATVLLTCACFVYLVERIREKRVCCRIYRILEKILEASGADPNNEKGWRIQLKERGDDEQ